MQRRGLKEFHLHLSASSSPAVLYWLEFSSLLHCSSAKLRVSLEAHGTCCLALITGEDVCGMLPFRAFMVAAQQEVENASP